MEEISWDFMTRDSFTLAKFCREKNRDRSKVLLRSLCKIGHNLPVFPALAFCHHKRRLNAKMTGPIRVTSPKVTWASTASVSVEGIFVICICEKYAKVNTA